MLNKLGETTMLNRWLRKTARLIASLVAMLAITACGGGGGDGVGSGGFLGASAHTLLP